MDGKTWKEIQPTYEDWVNKLSSINVARKKNSGQPVNTYVLFHSTSNERAAAIKNNGFVVGTEIKDKGKGSSLVYFSNYDNEDIAVQLLNEKGKYLNKRNAKTITGELDIEGRRITRINYEDRNKGFPELEAQLMGAGLSKEGFENWRGMYSIDEMVDDPIGELFKAVENEGLDPRQVLGDIVIHNDGETIVEITMFPDVANSMKNVQVIPFAGSVAHNKAIEKYGYWNPLFNKGKAPNLDPGLEKGQ